MKDGCILGMGSNNKKKKNPLSGLLKVSQSEEKLQIVYLAFVFPKDYAFNLEINVL